MTNPARTLRKLAKQATTEESRLLITQFATELEEWENRLNNQLQAVVSLTELHLTERLDRLEARLLEHAKQVGGGGDAL